MSKITVQLLSHTAYPIETVYCVWQRSRDPQYQSLPRDPHRTINQEEALKIFNDVINTDLPLAEFIEFTFWLDNVPISLREQLVRHRIGVKVGGVPDVDVVPNIADSTWWAQGMRVMDMATFFDEVRYHTPESIATVPRASSIFALAMSEAQHRYRQLCEMGIPREDARQVIPLGATHGLAWKLNLQALKHIIGHRTCWILQIGLWEDVIRGMIGELVQHVHPSFKNLINPPCIKGDRYTGCVFRVDNHRRLTGEDEPPPCTLYMNKEAGDAQRAIHFNVDPAVSKWHLDDHGRLTTQDQLAVTRQTNQAVKYGKLWGRDPVTGERQPGTPENPAEPGVGGV